MSTRSTTLVIIPGYRYIETTKAGHLGKVASRALALPPRYYTLMDITLLNWKSIGTHLLHPMHLSLLTSPAHSHR